MSRFDVTIAGELNLDLILYGLPEQLPPERELLADRMMLTLGSSSAIVAHNLAALGSRVGFQSRIGDGPPQVRRDGSRIVSRPHHEITAAGHFFHERLRHLRNRDIQFVANFGSGIGVEAPVMDVSDNSHDLHGAGKFGAELGSHIRNSDALSDGIFVGENSVRQNFIDHHYGRGVAGVPRLEESAA